VELADAGHWLAADHPDQLLQQIVRFLEGPAVCCFDSRALPGNGSGGGSADCVGGTTPVRAEGRRPELLGLRPLPQFSSVEEAQKVWPVAVLPWLWCPAPCVCVLAARRAAGQPTLALHLPPHAPWLQALGPRRIPTAAAVDEELRRMRVEEGRPPSAPSSDDEGESGGGHGRGGGGRTALARDPPDYFGFMG
jgi:hypothetical protein